MARPAGRRGYSVVVLQCEFDAVSIRVLNFLFPNIFLDGLHFYYLSV